MKRDGRNLSWKYELTFLWSEESKGYINPIQGSSKDTLFTLRSFAFFLCPVAL